MKGLEGEDLKLVNDFKEKTFQALEGLFFGGIDLDPKREIGSTLGVAKFVANVYVHLSEHLKDRYTEEQINNAISSFLSENISIEINKLKGR